MRWRLRLCLRPGPDHANWAELVWRWGRFAAWRRSKMTAASLPRGAATWARGRIRSWSLGVRLDPLRVPFEDHLLIIAPPRRRKTALLARLLQRFPGPAIATSTKPDLFGLTSGLRSHGGRPGAGVQPAGPGRSAPLVCLVAAGRRRVWRTVAIRRADAFAATVSQKGVEEGSFWSRSARTSCGRCFWRRRSTAGTCGRSTAGCRPRGRPVQPARSCRPR